MGSEQHFRISKAARSFLLIGAVVILSLCAAHAQTIVGRISGTVSDSSGAVIPGVKVTVTHEGTELSREALTDDSGFYVVTNLPVGPYRVMAEMEGFKRAVKAGYNLVADGRVTVDFKLEIGELAQSVEVISISSDTVNNTSGELARVIDGSQVLDLALNGRNYMQLISLIPGAALLTDDQMALTTSLSITGQSVNGNRGNTNHLSVDGGSNMDSGSNGSQINNVGIDFIREVKIQTSNFSAEYGRNSGASINVVTRSGEDKYHGSLFEFFRNDRLDARNFFSPEKSKLRFNNYDWSLGGPIKKGKLFFFAGQEWKSIRRDTEPLRRTLPTRKGKLFFFAGQEWKSIRRDTEPLRRTLPTRAERAGDFSGRVRSGLLRDPASPFDCTANDRRGCFADVRIPAERITPNGRAIAAVYEAMEKRAVSYTDQPIGFNTIYQVSNPFDMREDIVRLDYRLSGKQSFSTRYLHDHYDLIDPFGTFSGSDLPTTPTKRFRPGTSAQAGHTWILGPKLVNEAKISASWNSQHIPPTGDSWKRSTYGFTFPQLFSGGPYKNGIPDVDIGGYANFRGPAFALLSPTTDIAVGDNLTVIRGQHSRKTGFLFIRNRKDQNGRPSYTSRIVFNSTGNEFATGVRLGVERHHTLSIRTVFHDHRLYIDRRPAGGLCRGRG